MVEISTSSTLVLVELNSREFDPISVAGDDENNAATPDDECWPVENAQVDCGGAAVRHNNAADADMQILIFIYDGMYNTSYVLCGRSRNKQRLLHVSTKQMDGE